MRGELVRAGREALKRFYERGKGATLGDVARLLALASKLGRLASGLATDKTEVTGPDNGPIRVEFEMMLKKIIQSQSTWKQNRNSFSLIRNPGRKEGNKEDDS